MFQFINFNYFAWAFSLAVSLQLEFEHLQYCIIITATACAKEHSVLGFALIRCRSLNRSESTDHCIQMKIHNVMRLFINEVELSEVVCLD